MARFDCATWLPVQNHGGALARNLGLVLHHAVATGSLHTWFDNPSSGVSAHFWVGLDGTIEQYVDSDLTAWHAMQMNDTYCGVETEGCAAPPHDQPMSDAMVDALARLYAEGNARHGWPNQLANGDGEAGFGYHRMGVATACPCDARLAMRSAILQLAFAAGPDEEDDMPLSDADKQWITSTVHSQVLAIVRSDEFKGRVRDGSQLVVDTDEFKSTVRDQANTVATTWVRSDEFKGRVRDGCELALDPPAR